MVIVVCGGWALDKPQVILPLLVAILLGVVVAASFLFGWDTAWTVGAFLCHANIASVVHILPVIV